jgi:hypothetical protein
MIRKGCALVLAALVVTSLASCGGDDDGTVAGDAPTTSEKMADSSTTMEMHDEGDPIEENPCAPGGSGEMPGMDSEMVEPADGAKAVTITASEYEFSGTDALKAGGQLAITFENSGKELHELHIAKLPDDEKRPLEEFLKDPKAESMTKTVGHSFACPGKTADAVGADLTAPGRYAVVCFMPTGAMANTDPKDFEKLGPPHAFQGMAVEVDVS